MIEAADLDRATNTGRIFNLHRIVVDHACPPCNGACNQGRLCSAQMPAEACTELGAEPSERDRSAAARFWRRYLLVLAVACIAGAVAWLR